MATLTRTAPLPAADDGLSARERAYRTRMMIRNIVVYIFLGIIALLMLFPFIYMLFTSLKTSMDVSVSPPRLLPYSPITVMYNGVESILYEIPYEGGIRQMVEVEENIPFGFFTTPDLIDPEDERASQLVAQVPLDQARDLGRSIDVNGQEFDLFEVDIDGVPTELVRAYRGALSRFVDPNDPTVEGFDSERTATRLERIEFQWQNYNAVLTLNNLNRSLINTTIVTIGVTLGQITTSLLGGYAFSRMSFRGKEAVFLVYLGTIMIPFVVLIIPLYQVMVVIGWQDRLAALIIPWIFTAYGTFLMRQFFVSIPKELEEAAFLDGLSRFGILWRVFVPLSGPAIATQAIITFLYAWNSFLWPLVIIGDSPITNHVLTLSLITLRTAFTSEPNLVLTGAAVAILPPLILFVLAQKYFVEGIANTGLK